MKESLINLKLEPRRFQDARGWYALAIWGDRPPEQVGFFATKEEAEEWIAEVLSIWTRFKGNAPKQANESERFRRP